MTPRGSWRRWAVRALVVVLGMGIGLGAFTFHYAKGTSYLTDDPRACANCHIMQSQFDSWQKASHHAVATCVGCHLPAEGLDKYVAKAVNGFNHSRAFTFQDFPEPIRITPRNARALQANCLRCHGAFVHDQVAGGTGARDALDCVRCHRTVGHGDSVGLGGARRPGEGGP